MKPYKFLIPVAIAVGALAGNTPKANAITQPVTRIEQAAGNQRFPVNGDEQTLLLRLGDQGAPFAQRGSHASHASHASHSSHSSGM